MGATSYHCPLCDKRKEDEDGYRLVCWPCCEARGRLEEDQKQILEQVAYWQSERDGWSVIALEHATRIAELERENAELRAGNSRDSEVERLRWQLARRDEVLGSLAEQCCYTHTWPSCGECAPCRAREVLGLPAK